MAIESKRERERWFPYGANGQGEARRLFCLPYAGVGASAYRRWALSDNPGDLRVFPIQLPGRENRIREQPHSRMGSLLPPLLEALRPLLDQPFALFGHSMGALIAFELARALCRLGFAQPGHLFVSGAGAPHRPAERPALHPLPRERFLDEIRRLGGLPEAVEANEELMEMALPILRADFALGETYEHRLGTPLRCPISAYGGRDDPFVTPERIGAWRELTTGEFALGLFDGGHFYLHERWDTVIDSVRQAWRPAER